MASANAIPVAHTPVGFWQGEMPPPLLLDCDEPLAAGVPDLRGLWRGYAVEVNGSRRTDTAHVERIEQCGNRVVITAVGVIHDMRIDGTLEHGVNDVAARTGQPISVAASIEDGKLALRPFNGPVAVTRERIGDELIVNFVVFGRLVRMWRA